MRELWRRWMSRPSGAVTTGAPRFVAHLMRAPDEADVRWLAGQASGDDLDRATWELRYARRALGLLIAQREAADDRTGSAVSRHLVDALATDRSIAANMVALATRQFNERLSAYREMLQLRGSKEADARRLGRCLLIMSGGVRFDREALEGAEAIMGRMTGDLRAALIEAFGAAELPQALQMAPGPSSAAE